MIMLLGVVVVWFLILIVLLWEMKRSLVYERMQDNLPVACKIKAFGKCNSVFLNCFIVTFSKDLCNKDKKMIDRF